LDGPTAQRETLTVTIGTERGLAILVRGPDFTLVYDAGSNHDDARGPRNGNHSPVRISAVEGGTSAPNWPAPGMPIHCACGDELRYRHIIDELCLVTMPNAL
jgi:hypothetical protein